jgi:4-hydroxybenzoate polyprenyltransferase
MPKTRRWRRGATEAEPADTGPDSTAPTTAPATTAPATGSATTATIAPSDEAENAEDEAPFSFRNLTPVLLLRTAHPRQAVVTALALAVAGALQGRAMRELLLIAATVLVGQAVLGWFNDLVDRRKDARYDAASKPVADGRLDPGTVWFVMAIGVFVVVPLSVANGVVAGSAYLLSLAIGLAGQWVRLRKGFFSWVPWAAAFALYPAFLSYGGWGGQYRGDPPEVLVTVLAAMLGIGVHFLRALWGLVPDNAEGWTYLPLKLGLRIGASKLLWVSTIYTVLVLVGLAFAGTYVGLTQSSS